ncbi:UNVERIFIED_CONTAM: putative glutathione peroxidase 2 [Sesamum angustifolium]|uniref:Glutathione peroxidase n=1 Tax=Sesamum angustifolium TaxID=2727405 RepID=A0AAW2IUJ2_9LAMI
MFFSRPITWVSLIFLGLAFWLHYSYPAAKDMAAEPSKSIYDFTVKDIHGNDVPLSNYQGKVLLIVNVASKCGLTQSNYKELNVLYEKYKDQGFEILAFPCNQFASQEPGTNEEIQETACTRFKAEFPIFEKNTAPLYKFLKSEKGGVLVDAIKWNFTKFLVNKEGKVVQRYSPTTSPLAIEVAFGLLDCSYGAMVEKIAQELLLKDLKSIVA